MKILLKLVKYACCCAMIFVAIVLIAGSTNDAKKNPAFLIIPALMALAGYCTYRVAKRKALEGSAFTWWLYGTFVPVVSWMDVHKAKSPVKSAPDASQPYVSSYSQPVRMPGVNQLQVTWEMWEMEHDKPEQRKRWMRASTDCSLDRMLDISQGVAVVKGNRGGEYTTSLVMCSCPDFAKRRKPCKHMYFLAHHMGLFDPFNLHR